MNRKIYKISLRFLFLYIIVLTFSCERLKLKPLPAGIPEGSKRFRSELWSYTSPEGEFTAYSDDGFILMRGQFVKGSKEGIWTTYTQNGNNIASTGKYLNDWRDGIWNYNDTEGNLYLMVNYTPFPRRNFFITKDYGNENGIYKRFYPDGILEEVGYFKSGYFEGVIQRYYRNKNLALKGLYSKDLMDGTWVYYYPEGNIEREENYLKGKKHGKFRNYHPDGTLYHETTFKENIEIGPRIIHRGDTVFKIDKGK